MEKYRQIGEMLKKKIATGFYSKGARIPSEKELADFYGVSSQTINKAISILVSEKLLSRKKGYGASVREDINLNSIKKSCDFQVGILFDSEVTTLTAADRIFTRIAFNIQHQLTRSGIHWTIYSQTQRKTSPDFIPNLDGLIILGDASERELKEISKYKIPCAALNRNYLSYGISSVVMSDEGILSMVEHLHIIGCRNFLYVIDADTTGIYAIREAEFRKAVEEIGGTVETILVPELRQASKKIPGETLSWIAKADAVFSPNDSIAISLMQSLDEAGLSVPGDIAVCGFDNSIAGRHYHVPLTTIAYDIHNACSLIVEIMVDILFNNKKPEVQYINSWLILRDSTKRK